MSMKQIKAAIGELGFWDLLKISLADDLLLLIKFWYVWFGLAVVIIVVAWLISKFCPWEETIREIRS